MVRVVIKSPTHLVSDLKVDCELSWTVGQVKDKVSILYPSNPRRDQQKLIYGGKLLPDHLFLSEALNKTQEMHTMHLVCPLPPNPEVPKVPEVDKNTNAFAAEALTNPPVNPMYSGVNERLLDPQNFANFPGYGTGVNANMAYPSGDVNVMYQYMAMQQMYSQFMTQYLSQVNGGAAPANPYELHAAQATAPPPVPNNPPEPVVNENVVHNVQEQRPAVNREDVERDYIDWLYIMSRAAMLLAILYYYSSLNRILTVFVLGIFISFFVKMHYQRQVEELRRQRVIDAAAERASNNNGTDIQASRNDETNSDEPASPDSTDDSTDETAIREAAQPHISTLNIIINFFTTLVTSLIPSEPAPLNVN